MHVNLDLEYLARARVWLDELPAGAVYASGEVRTQLLEAAHGSRTAVRSAAVELFEPQGGRYAYALLGGQFEPDDAARLVIQTWCTGDDGVAFPASARDARVGLPAEFAAGVVEGVRRAGEEMPLMSGRLSFRCAAHSAVGSSHDIFARLATIVVRLIQAGHEDLRKLFER